MSKKRNPQGQYVEHWTPEEDAILRAGFDAGLTDHAIAERISGRPWQSVRSRRYRLGLKHARGSRQLASPPGWQGYANGVYVYWTDRRVIAALRDYARAHPGELPRGTKTWDVITNGVATLPVSGRILRQFGSLGAAWRAVLPPAEYAARVPRLWVPYTEAEDELIVRLAPTTPMREIASRLERPVSAVRAHAKRALGIVSADERDWWSPQEVADHYGCPVARVRALVARGLIVIKKTTRVQIDPRYLPGIGSDYDQREIGAEARARLDELERLLRAPHAHQPKPVAIRRHGRAGHNDVITRVPQSQQRRVS